jgi:predicted metal-dependent hydrolase
MGNWLAAPCLDSFTGRVEFEFDANPAGRSPMDNGLTVGGRRVPLVFVRNPRARRYVLRLRPDGSARVTIPRGGSATEAGRFIARNLGWLERQLQRRASRPLRPKEWSVGTEILFRGEPIRIEAGSNGESGMIRVGSEKIRVLDHTLDLRRSVESHLWSLAAQELPQRVFEYAAEHQLPVRRVTVRNQRTRWGSCSRRGTVSLNWRLIQTPRHVQDYIILHELCHLREMNHSVRFWREVARICPDFETAERWLKQHSALLR